MNPNNHRLYIVILLSFMVLMSVMGVIVGIIMGMFWRIVVSLFSLYISSYVFRDYLQQGSPPRRDE